MNHASAILPFDLKRLALLAALLILLRCLALDLHHIVADHQVDEPCELCLVVERGGNAVAQATLLPAPHASVVPGGFLPAPPAVPALAWRPPPRGPPVSLS